MEREIKRTIPLAIPSKTILRIKLLNSNDEVEDLCTENCKPLMKKNEEDTNKYKKIKCSWNRINIFKMVILYKTIYKFNATPIKIPIVCFKET